MKAVEVRENVNCGLRYAFGEKGGVFVQGLALDPLTGPWLRTRVTRWDAERIRERSRLVEGVAPELPAV